MFLYSRFRERGLIQNLRTNLLTSSWLFLLFLLPVMSCHLCQVTQTGAASCDSAAVTQPGVHCALFGKRSSHIWDLPHLCIRESLVLLTHAECFCSWLVWLHLTAGEKTRSKLYTNFQHLFPNVLASAAGAERRWVDFLCSTGGSWIQRL